MSHSEEKHPEAFEYVRYGGFLVQLGEGNPFGSQETVNKDTQAEGGTKGFSLKAGAVSKYYLIAKYHSIFLRLMKDMLDLNQIFITPISRAPELSEMRELSLVSTLQSHWLDPFNSVQQDLVCLSTGKVAPPEVQQDLLVDKAIEEKAREIFRVQRLESQPAKTKFHDTVPERRSSKHLPT